MLSDFERWGLSDLVPPRLSDLYMVIGLYICYRTLGCADYRT